MPLKLNDVLVLRRQLADHSQALEPQARRLYLSDQFAPQAAPGTLAAAGAAIAHTLWVKHGFHSDLKDGLHHLRCASEGFAALAAKNRLLAFLSRDLAIFRGADVGPGGFIQAKPAYERLIAWLSEQKDEVAVNFYRLEWQLFMPLVKGKEVSNKRTYLDKTRYLARLVQRDDFYAVAAATLKLVDSDKLDAADYAALRQAYLALSGTVDHLLYHHHLLQAARLCAERRWFAQAAELLEALQTLLRQQLSALPTKLAAQLGQNRNALQDAIAAQQAKLPEALTERLQQVGSFLLP